MSTEPFWYSEPNILFTQDTWSKFVPTADMPVSTALNAVVRFSVYLAILLFLSSMRPAYLLIIPLVMGVTVALNMMFPKARKIVESFGNGLVVSGYVGDMETRPSNDNPFMNPHLTDILDSPNMPPAADVTRKDIRNEVNAAFAKTSNIYMDTTDIFEMVQAQRNFHTVATDDHAGLLKFLGKGQRTDKLLSEGYVAAKGTVPGLPSSQSIDTPTGSQAVTTATR
jgi:Family of unknown function (DUF5762)